MEKISKALNYGKFYLKELNNTSNVSPKYSLVTYKEGQANYIACRCKEENILAKTYHSQVMIYSKRKLPLFIDIIYESFLFENREAPTLSESPTVFKEEQSLVCVLTNDKVYVTSDKLERYLFYCYKKAIPKINFIKIFDKKKEMASYLLDHLNIII